MNDQPLSINSFPRAILHIDGDAFFASCEQSRDPALKGKPVITGKERGIAASMSYEAKAKGVTRGMRLSEIKKVCPDAILLPSDYETYSLLSKRFYEIVRRYTPDVEEYSIDECFADITGLRRPLRMNYPKIAEKIKSDLDGELGFTFSAGLGPNKTIAKVGSKWKKPSGLTIIPGYYIHRYLAEKYTEDIWGIGSQTSAYLKKEKVNTALEFARKSEEWVKEKFTKPIQETWRELNGKFVFELETKSKDNYASIQKVRTFTPPSKDRQFIFSQLSKNIENACIKLRRYNLVAKSGVFFLKLQNFRYSGIEVKFSRPTCIPSDIVNIAREHFGEMFNENGLYRATGVMLLKLGEDKEKQLDLFGEAVRGEGLKKLYDSVDKVNEKFGKHTLFLGSSFLANKFSQHLGDRGDTPQRKSLLFRGETKRKRLAIPMFVGNVV
jgi:DNA polymerase-4/DNA polymerase V